MDVNPVNEGFAIWVQDREGPGALIAHVTSSPSIALRGCVTIHECSISHPYGEDGHYWLLAHCSVVKEPMTPHLILRVSDGSTMISRPRYRRQSRRNPKAPPEADGQTMTPDRIRIVTKPVIYASQSTRRAKRRFPTLSTLPTSSERATS
jgi:hypothetical protein